MVTNNIMEGQSMKIFGKILGIAAFVFVLICTYMSLAELYRATRPENRVKAGE